MTKGAGDKQRDYLEQIRDVLSQQVGLAAAWLYGSRARGEYRDDSDFDIAVALNNFEKTYSERRLLPEIMAQDLTAQLGHPVQVVDISLAPIPLAINILEDGHPLLIKDELRYCRETNRIYGLWNDHCWHKAETHKEKQA